MRRVFSLLLAVALLAGVGYAVYTSVRGRGGAAEVAVVRGVIGSEKAPFFADAEVAAVFARNGLRVQVDTAGSRAIATLPQLGQYDFGFPAGVPAAERIRRDRKVAKTYQPFSTPMAIATYKPIAEILRANGVAVPMEHGYWRFDMAKYLALVEQNRRWNQLRDSRTYDSGKSVLITSTDVRTSNSAAMYLSIASYVLNGDSIVESTAQADKAVDGVAPLFLRQGLTGASSEEPFEDYLTIGMGKTPMVMVYEAQYLARAIAKDGAIRPDMVLMYPTPDLTGGLDPADLDQVMTAQARRIAGKVPHEIEPAVARIHHAVRDLIHRDEGLIPGTPEAFIVRQTVLDYLPAALEGYLRLPRRYADNVALAGSGGRTARQLLAEQLALMEAKLGEITEAVLRGDADRLLAHGRFLADRFATGTELDIDDQGKRLP